MKKISLIILSSAVLNSSVTVPKSITASNIAAIAAICKETSKAPWFADTPYKDLLKGIWAGLAWYDTAENLGPSTRSAFKNRSAFSWLAVAHAASAASYMTLSLAKTLKKYRAARNDDQDQNNGKGNEPLDSSEPNENQNENNYTTTTLAKGLSATGTILLATLKFPDLKGRAKDAVLGSAYGALLYSDSEYIGQRASNAWANQKVSLDDAHALSAAAFLTTTIAVTALKSLRSSHRVS